MSRYSRCGRRGGLWLAALLLSGQALAHDDMSGMAMDGSLHTLVMLDQLEVTQGRDGAGQRWEGQGWAGGDIDRLWLRSEGDSAGGSLRDGDVEAFWSHAVSPFWVAQTGMRQDLGAGARTWGAIGLQGLAPYWINVEATAYVGEGGRLAGRLRSSYDLWLTQRLVAQPELEANAYSRADAGRDLGSGPTDLRLGLRLRYEIRHEFAPYVGVEMIRHFGETAGLISQAGQPAQDVQAVAGIRLWF